MKLSDDVTDDKHGGEVREHLGDDSAPGLDSISVGENDWLLVVGCEAGSLNRVLLARLGTEGRVIGIDVSEAAVALAAANANDVRASFHVADALHVPVSDECIDTAFFTSAWPHLENPMAVATEMLRVLRPGGTLHVWHPFLRQRGDAAQLGADESLRRELLAPAADTATLLIWAGYATSMIYEKPDSFLVTASKEKRSLGSS